MRAVVSVPEAYSEIAQLYAELFSDELAQHEADQEAVQRLLALVVPGSGRLVGDIGCGPARLVGQLEQTGVAAVGIDGATEMLAIARSEMATGRLAQADIGALPVATGALGGLVSRHSVIHLPPAELPRVFAEFRRVLAAGAPALVIFSVADDAVDHGDPFDHKVATAHRYHVESMVELLRAAGFATVDAWRRAPSPNERGPTAAMLGS